MGQTTSRSEDISVQAPATLMTGMWWGAPQISAPSMTEIEHPAVNAGMGGTSVATGGGRMNSWGRATPVDFPRPFRHEPTRNMPRGVPFAENIIEPRMGGEIVGDSSQPVSWRQRFVSDNRNANPASVPDNWGSTIFSR
jgi:hypothetical protein